MNWDEAQVTDLGWGGVGDSHLNDAWNAVQYTHENVEEPGFIHEVKDAFAKFDYGGRFVKWLDEMPYGEVLHTWEVRTIWINNPVLQAVLLDIFKGHPDVRCGSEVLEFKAPFAPLIHLWEQLCKLAGDNVGSEIQELVKLFVDMLKEELQDTLIRVKKIKETGLAAHGDLRFVFKPGQLFFCSKAPIAAGISRTYAKGRLSVNQIAWTGSAYATVNSTFHVPFFHGTQPLSELSVRPIWACPENDIKNMKAALVKRGRKYEGLRGIHLRFHQGQGQSQADTPQGHQESSSNHGAGIPIAEINWEATATCWERLASQFKRQKDESLFMRLDLTGVLNANGNDSKASTSGKHQEAQESSVRQNKERGDPDRLTDDEAMLTVSIVNCFSLGRKVWCYAEIESLTEIEWNTQALNNLVVDEAEKRLLVGFVGATKNGQLQHFDDFVHGKGKGLVMLLCGPPGTGKTFTAESVSENLKRPLYRLDSSDLGMWRADVFLEKRSSSNLTQNEMTTIFLRLLEYYKGVMILTTNRYPAIDPAFESRIDLSFVFQDLEPASRGKIWYNFLIREDKALAEDSNAIAKLAGMPMNGRQIKSAVKTARVLAASENLPLAVDHLQTVVFMGMKALKMME
ncbi:AAA family ATPase [Fusarium bulbicola]|nr:AAA family ATPase [Fusarium bulbicola]